MLSLSSKLVISGVLFVLSSENLYAEQFRDCDVCPEMVVVPAGEFTMGSPNGEKGRNSNEGPQHRVWISKPFAVGRFEVTFAEWDACVADGGCGGHRPDDRGWGRDRRPVIEVSWDDAKAYVKWLSGKTGENYRLLSEAEWEYAARAGTTTRFYFGDTISKDQAKYGNGSFWGTTTVPVNSFPANRFGLYDMHGNVWEWVEDCWHDSYKGAPQDGSAWLISAWRTWLGGECEFRVLRGGSWINGPEWLRSAARFDYQHGRRLHDLGFRVARTL